MSWQVFAPNSGNATVTAWAAMTVTGSWNTNTTYTAVGARVGPNLLLKIFITLAGAPNNTDLVINVPGGLSINTSGLATTTANRAIVGTCRATDAGTAAADGQIYYASATTMTIAAANGSTSNLGLISQSAPWTWANNDSIYCECQIPIVGW